MTTNMMKHATKPKNFPSVNAQKKSDHPTQPGNRSTAPKHSQRNRKQLFIVHQIFEIVKRVNLKRIIVLGLAVLGVIHLFCLAFGNEQILEPDATVGQVTVDPDIVKEQQTPPTEYIFRDGDGSPVNVQNMTNAWATNTGIEKRYDLTDAERWEIASVVTAEAQGEPFAGKVAVAQCILQACEDDGIRPNEAVVAYKYCKSRPEPSEEALEAVAAVFDHGQVVTDEPIKFYYAPALVYSDWHESQNYVMTINGHRFFKEAE